MGSNMAESVVLVAQRRQGRGSKLARRLRQDGRVPAVIYGHKEETVSLSLVAEDLVKAIRHGVRVVDLQTDGGVQKAFINDVQWDHLGKDVLHVDFTRVAADERIHVTVPLELRGIAPGVTGGGILDQPLHTLDVECEAVSVPESIRVNINELQLDGVIHVRDLTLPPGVVARTDPDVIVVHVTVPAAAVAAPAAEAPAGQVGPEVIGRPRAEEEGE
jgi:large subunit ribosomal protein L25